MDILAVGAHPDDVEIGCGGTLRQHTRAGHSVTIVDLTAGENSSNGTVEERWHEAQCAAAVLGVKERHCLKLSDGNLTADVNCAYELSELIRRLKPNLMLIPYRNDSHPDHRSAYELSRLALFRAGLRNEGSDYAAHRGTVVLEYYINTIECHDRYFDITETAVDKMEALKCHKTQFILTQNDVPTSLNQGFLEHIQVRDQYWGYTFQCRYAEVFHAGKAAELRVDTWRRFDE